MRNIKTYITIILSMSIANIYAQLGNIRFTAIKNPAQNNQVLIYGKNFSSTLIEGNLGNSNITLCVTFPSALSGAPTITSPIAGQTFAAPLLNKNGSDSIYTWNGTGSTGIVSFPGGGATEVQLATVTFNSGGSGITATVKIADIAQSGPSGFDYCYIAPGGVEQSGFSTPFYSNIVSDPLLINSGGPNDPNLMGNSSLGISNVALPVKFLGFTASRKEKNAILNWQIANESALTNHYEIERSLSGTDFRKIATVQAKNNGNSTNSYDLTDLNLTAVRSVGIFYYRIKQVDKDNRFVYSEIRNLRLNSKGIAIGVYPNPTRNVANVTIDLEQDAEATVTITDASGKQVQNNQVQLFKGLNIKKINMSSLSAGSYILKVETATEAKTMPVVKTN